MEYYGEMGGINEAYSDILGKTDLTSHFSSCFITAAMKLSQCVYEDIC